MLNFYLYLYYRSVKFYGGSNRGIVTIQTFPAFNTATLFIIIYKLLIATGSIMPGENAVLVSLLVTCCFILIAIPVTLVMVWLYKAEIGKKFIQFDRDSLVERKRKGRRILIYFISSLLLLILSFII